MGPEVRKERLQVRYWAVTYKFSLFFDFVEKNSLITEYAKIASTVYETENCLTVNQTKPFI